MKEHRQRGFHDLFFEKKIKPPWIQPDDDRLGRLHEFETIHQYRIDETHDDNEEWFGVTALPSYDLDKSHTGLLESVEQSPVE
jgi:hypothetical protein